MSHPILNAAQMHRQGQVSSTVRNGAETHACASSARTHLISNVTPSARAMHRQVTLKLRGVQPFPVSCKPATLQTTTVRATKIPDYNEDRDAAHSAFVSAFDAAKPGSTKIPGLQEFAGSIWERRRRIPSQLYNDPLTHLFQEFDLDDDGSLTAAEISKALVSRGVRITPEQVQVFIEAADSNSNHTIEQHEFADLIFHMASADLNREHHAPSPSSEDDPL